MAGEAVLGVIVVPQGRSAHAVGVGVVGGSGDTARQIAQRIRVRKHERPRGQAREKSRGDRHTP